MSDFDRPGTAVEEPTRRRSSGSLFGDLGDRLARTFGGVERPRSEVPAWNPRDVDYAVDDDTVAWEQTPPRFPVTRLGYDCDVVDEHVATLERELSELRIHGPRRESVTAEIDRLGEQTATILKVAHEKAREITADAQRQADNCLADAAANAVSMTEEANRKLRQIDSETDAIWQERSRLIEDVRTVATALFTLAEEAVERFPGESEKIERSVPPRAVAAQGQITEGGQVGQPVQAESAESIPPPEPHHGDV
jgi:hypothetical protein